MVLWLQANSTLPGRRMLVSPSYVQHAQQGEQPARGVEVDINLARELLSQQLRAFIVQAAPSHVDRFDPRRTGRADRRVVTLADQEVIANDPAERLQRHREAVEDVVAGGSDLDDEAAFLEADLQVERSRQPRRRA